MWHPYRCCIRLVKRMGGEHYSYYTYSYTNSYSYTNTYPYPNIYTYTYTYDFTYLAENVFLQLGGMSVQKPAIRSVKIYVQ